MPKGTGSGGMPDLSAFMPKSGGGLPGGLPKSVPGLESTGGLTGGLATGDKPANNVPSTVTSEPAPKTDADPAPKTDAEAAPEAAPKEACKPGRKWKRHGPCDD